MNLNKALNKGITSNTSKEHVFDSTNKKINHKNAASTRKKIPSNEVKNIVVSFKISAIELEAISKKFIIGADRPALLARHYLREKTDFFE
ncbi:hypothetical protein BHECKSOX_1091 [Bathymodiolus heckerae thiotrophic gill symbiont]|uniref:hypothetical protein n=1 Tax=Bathymodiolus heckerae thiotrophic gill symbiont TaxID=1052212 RepID=UPI0010B78B91|nr:hypothetical protein [Bathymodiolus heckerae thiotrophic gill symbiont]CAC9585400.1 hypothetical protein [uncultured Gammaproteobacteria bacterium]SHN92561.1 hypothetical protein BHECKSOX_1091 [Bathymodiolus heckerae thiotrophic gill symbiont]